MATNQTAASAFNERHVTCQGVASAESVFRVWWPLLAALCNYHPDPERKDGRRQSAVIMERLYGRPLLDDTEQLKKE